MPPRVMAPGEFISYSNHGMALAGHLVEQASGVPFERYMVENVFGPLGMSRSSFGPPASTAELAVGYQYDGSAYRVRPYDFIRTVPASMLTTTGLDMARFMVAHLADGGDATAILSEAAARAMHRRQFSQHPSLPGVAFGFWERFQNGERALWHDGDTPGFTSLLYLLPDQGVGLFVAYNSRGGNAAREELLAAFLDRFYPDVRPPAPSARAEVSTDLARFAGTYVFNRRVRRGMEKIVTQGNTLAVGSLAGALILDGKRYVPEAPLLFRREDGKRRLAFREDARGRITHVFTGGAIARVYERRRWHETPGLHVAAAAFCVLAFLLACLRSLRNLFRRRHTNPRADRWAWSWATLASVLDLGFLIGFALLLARFADVLEYRVPPALVVLLVVPMLSAVATVALLGFCGRAWRRPWPRSQRLLYTWVTLAAVLWIVLLDYWNLLGFRY